jgi:hypothetical protein
MIYFSEGDYRVRMRYPGTRMNAINKMKAKLGCAAERVHNFNAPRFE